MQKEQKTALIYIILLIILCFAVYSNSLNNAFVSDDIGAILENTFISQPSRYLLEPTNFLNSLIYLVSGFNPFSYHLINIILHSINTILVFFFLRLFFKTESSFLAACLFATHPIHTEAVTWISGKPYLILTLFILTIYFLYHSATNSIIISRRNKIIRYMLSLSIFSYFILKDFGFFSLTPLLLILSDVTFKRWRKSWKLWIPFLVIVILRIILARGIISEHIFHMVTIIGNEEVSQINPIVKLTNVLFLHLGLLLWPVKLVFPYVSLRGFPITLELGAISLFFLIISLPFIFKKSREIFFGVCLFVLFLAPMYSPVAVTNVVAERYLYFPSISLCIFAAFLYERYAKNSYKSRRIMLSLFILIMSLYSIRTIIRNEDWRTPERLWQATLAVSNNDPSVNNELGRVYHRKGDIKRAITYFKKAIQINPNYAMAYYNLGIVYGCIDNIDEEIASYKKAIKVYPNFAQAYNNLGAAYRKLGKIEEEIVLYKKAIEINPEYAGAYYNLAIAYERNKEYELAIECCDKARELGFISHPLLESLESYREQYR